MGVEAIALLVIDVQRAFDLRAARGETRNNPQAVDRIAALLAAFRAANRAIIHVRHANETSGSVFHPDGPGYLPLDEAVERPGEPVIRKCVNSAFIGTDLEKRLRDAGIVRLAICGATTNHCVETTTRMAGNLGFDAWVVEDAWRTFDRRGPDGRLHRAEDIHAMTLSNLHDEFARIVRTDEVIAAVSGILEKGLSGSLLRQAAVGSPTT